MTRIRIAALDGSLRNFGIAKLDLEMATMTLSVADLILVKTEKSKNKQVRISSDYLAAAQKIDSVLKRELEDCAVAFYEVPSGGQDYRAVMGFGIVIGLYASIIIPGIEVSPSETKLAAVGTKSASKEEMIEWAVAKFPDAPWLRAKQNSAKLKKGDPINDNEHLADAVAIAHAGLQVPSFRQTLAILGANTAA